MKILREDRMVLTPKLMSNRTQRPLQCGPRTPGVHIQAINKKLGVAAGKLSDDSDEDFPFERFTEHLYPLMPAEGVAWEEFRASCYTEEELVWQPGELERDGIYGTPDGLYLLEDLCLWECKRTTKKLQRITDLWMYLKQGLSYCAMSGYNKVLYDINFGMGDYSRPFIPIGTVTLVEFEEHEINSWWKIVLGAKHLAKEEGK